MKPKIAPFSKASHNIRFTADRYSERHIRTYLLPIAATFVFLMGFVRLFHLTIVKGSYYRHIAEDNRIKEIQLEGKRGRILDRKGLVLADSTPSKDTPDSFVRTYLYGPALAHVIGYRQTASKEHLEDDACMQPLSVNDKVGIKGVEAIFECHLRAIKGKRLVETDAHGKAIRVISQVEPRSGQDMKLSIDSEIQQKALEIIEQNAISTGVEVDLSKKHISVIGLDPRNGEVLLLLSYPTFNPQDFENQSPIVSEYLLSEDKPLFDRALLGAYPPGSVFKPVIATGALEEDKITVDETIEDNGFIQAGPIKFHNWFYTQYGKTDGLVDLRKALQRSNDIYFYTIGERLSPEGIKKWARVFGFGQKTGIELDESTGSIPTEFWKKETIGEKWFLGDTYNLSIGQGYLLVTPLQIAHATSVFASKGKLCTPTLLRRTAKENQKLIEESSYTCTTPHISQETINYVREGMKRACESGGTGWPFFDFRVKENKTNKSTTAERIDKQSTPSATVGTRRIEVGCKTGTAESQSKDHATHAWFTIFAPYENPEIVLTIMVENSGEGSNVAAPLAKEILKAYFSRSE